MTMFVLSPLIKISRLDHDMRPVLHSGSGDNRGHFALDGTAAQPLIEWLLNRGAGADEKGLVDSLQDCTGLADDEARDLVQNMVSMRVLAPAGQHDGIRAHLARWGEFGWRDAADFHLATRNLTFIPDEVDGITYADHFSAMVSETESAGEQPPPYVPRLGQPLPVPVRPAPTVALDEVLASAQPVNRFDGPPVRGDELLAPLRAAFGTQRTVGGILGDHHLRSYPSGGARHPFEIYLVSKGVDDLPAGAYHFNPLSGDVSLVAGHGDPHDIEAACFGKGGIVTADVVLVLTCRWLRHSWKYRYARSYRMLLLEAGHIVQAINLAMLRHGVDVYHCPSISDDHVETILALDDDCAEGAIHALGLGHGGIR